MKQTYYRWILGLVLVFALILAGCNRNGGAAEDQPKPKKQVAVQVIATQDQVTSRLSVSGTVVPKEYSAIRSLTPGTVEYLAPVGSAIGIGEALFSIRDQNIESNYFNALQSHQQTTTLTQQRVSQAELNLSSAQARLDSAKTNLDITRRQIDQSLRSAQDSASVTYASAYNTLQQFLNFVSVGDLNNFDFRYRDITTPQSQLKIDTENEFYNTARQFLTLKLTTNLETLSTDLTAMHQTLILSKGLVDDAVVLLQNALGLPGTLQSTLSSDQTTITGYQTQINQLTSAILTANNALVNTQINNQLILDQASNQGRLTEIEFTNAEVALANAREGAQLEQTGAQSRLDAAAYSYSNLSLRSPFSGTILSHAIKVGEQAQVGQEMLELGNLSIVEIEVAVDADSAAGLKVGDSVTIDGRVNGLITELAPSADIQTGKLSVKVQGQNPAEDKLVAGSVVDVVFALTYQAPQSIVIPIKSAAIESAGSSVFVAEGGKAIKRDVVLGKIFGDQVSVMSGLNVGDQLILLNGTFIAEGDEVEVQR